MLIGKRRYLTYLQINSNFTNQQYIPHTPIFKLRKVSQSQPGNRNGRKQTSNRYLGMDDYVYVVM